MKKLINKVQNIPSDDNKRKSHILNLIMMAQADGKWHENEKKFIQSVAERIGLTEEEHQEVIFYPENIPFTPAKSEQERIVLLYDLLFMMKMDGTVTPEEEAFCLEVGLRIGFSPLMVQEMINVMRTYKASTIPDNSLIDILRKYLN